VAKRTNHKLLDRAQGMWLEVGMPHFIWTKAINIVTFLINHSLRRANPQMTLFQRLFKVMSMFDHVRVFGN
jgi:hypothetical protein